jgi:hypothetical protein
VPYVLALRHERRVDAEGFVQVQRAHATRFRPSSWVSGWWWPWASSR